MLTEVSTSLAVVIIRVKQRLQVRIAVLVVWFIRRNVYCEGNFWVVYECLDIVVKKIREFVQSVYSYSFIRGQK